MSVFAVHCSQGKLEGRPSCCRTAATGFDRCQLTDAALRSDHDHDHLPNCALLRALQSLNADQRCKSTLKSSCREPDPTISTERMSLPVLLPAKALPQSRSLSHLEWKPKRYLEEPQPPSNEDAQLQEEFIAKQALEGKIVKKTRPRRTVDYNGGMGRWALVS